jgi:hypothetical protein
MTRKGPTKVATVDQSRGRLEQARAFRAAVEAIASTITPGANGSPLMALIVTAAIAYGDALTARFGRVMNRDDHAASPKLVRATMGDRADEAMLNHLRAIIAEKTFAEYGDHQVDVEAASRFLVTLRRFATWMETTLSG